MFHIQHTKHDIFINKTNSFPTTIEAYKKKINTTLNTLNVSVTTMDNKQHKSYTRSSGIGTKIEIWFIIKQNKKKIKVH